MTHQQIPNVRVWEQGRAYVEAAEILLDYNRIQPAAVMAALALEIVGVGGGVAVVDPADVGGDSCLEEETFGQCGLTGVDMSDDSKVENGHGEGLPSGCSDRWE